MKRSLGLLVALGLTTLAVFFFAVKADSATREDVIAKRADEIFRSPTSAVVGNPDGDVTLVVFFDYNCPYCRKHLSALRKLTEADPNLRLVLKELPVLGADSEAAARVVLAAAKQNKDVALYWQLLGAQGRMTQARALDAAAAMGLDMDRLKSDMRIRRSPRRFSPICVSVSRSASGAYPSTS